MIMVMRVDFFILVWLQVDLWRPMAEMALCVWLHQPPGALGKPDHHNDDVDSKG